MTPRLNRNVREHFRRDGKPKKAYKKAEAQSEALKRRMHSYRCGVCDCWHLAR